VRSPKIELVKAGTMDLPPDAPAQWHKSRIVFVCGKIVRPPMIESQSRTKRKVSPWWRLERSLEPSACRLIHSLECNGEEVLVVVVRKYHAHGAETEERCKSNRMHQGNVCGW
jgi:hypothetical protein